MFVGFWCGDSSIEVVRIDGELYALHGWNSEKYLHCWKCVDTFSAVDEDVEYEITPIYRENECGDFELVGYEVA